MWGSWRMINWEMGFKIGQELIFNKPIIVINE